MGTKTGNDGREGAIKVGMTATSAALQAMAALKQEKEQLDKSKRYIHRRGRDGEEARKNTRRSGNKDNRKRTDN